MSSTTTDTSPKWVDPDPGSVKELEGGYWEFKVNGKTYTGHARSTNSGELKHTQVIFYVYVEDPEGRHLNVTVDQREEDWTPKTDSD